MTRISTLLQEAEREIQPVFKDIEEMVFFNQARVLEAFQAVRVREHHFYSSTGYGYNDMGRDLLEDIYARVFGAEDALVRSQMVSGTHAISLCLFGLLKPGDELVAAVGKPYDTLAQIIGIDRPLPDTLVDQGVLYREVPLREGRVDVDALEEVVGEQTKMVFIQRSRGYAYRPALLVDDIRQVVERVKARNPRTVCMVDNCYGEFTENLEPPQAGADITVGSLIKNPGGGLAPCGGYVVGKKEVSGEGGGQVDSTGLGKEVGASLWDQRLIYQGFFVALHVVGEALKGAVLVANVLEHLGYDVSPRWDEPRGDIVQAVKMGSVEGIRAFCQAIQGSSPVDGDVTLEFAPMPGYEEQIIMAAGTFIQGSSIELSCDAPAREPFAVYLQGGLTYQHVRYALIKVLEVLL